MGQWRELMEADLPRELFDERMTVLIGSFPYDWIIHAAGDKGHRPVGMVLGDSRAAGRGIEPHVEWFPWATVRNKVEGMTAYLRQVSKQSLLMIYVEEEERRFWDWMVARRELGRGCKIPHYFGIGGHAMFYYTGGG